MRRSVSACVVGLVLVVAAAAWATYPGTNGSIVERRYLDAKQSQAALVTIAPDGSGERQITTPPKRTTDDLADWSPDGRQIVFVRCPSDNVCHLMLVNADGTGLRTLTPICHKSLRRGVPRGCQDGADPSFTPDGQHVLYTRATGRVKVFKKLDTDQIEHSDLVEIGLDGKHPRVLVRSPAFGADVGSPLLSPDGRTLLFEEATSPLGHPRLSHAVFTAGADGRGVHRVTPWKLRAGDGPDWSPDGSLILFRSNEDVGDFAKSQLFTIHPDGSGLTQLTHMGGGARLFSSSFSPDGTRIVFATGPKGKLPDLFTMAADGSDVQQVTHSPKWDSRPDWGPINAG